ncbi:MAG TPA: hypothetical protein VGM41_08525, partial [Chitinophagaceae bacterium]
YLLRYDNRADDKCDGNAELRYDQQFSRLNSFWTHNRISVAAAIPIARPLILMMEKLLLRTRLRQAILK